MKASGLIRGLLRRREAQKKRVDDKFAAAKAHNRHVDKALGVRPKLGRYAYLAKKKTFEPDTTRYTVVDKETIAHFTPIISKSSLLRRSR